MWRTAALALATLIVAAGSAALRLRVDTEGSRGRRQGRSERLISLAPAITETCCALGLRGRLVGRSSFCDYPPDVRSIPDAGGLLDPNLERILSLRPDLLLVPQSGQDQRGLLDAAGIDYVALPNDSLEDVFTSIRLIGEHCGCAAAAANLEHRLRQRIEAAQGRAHGAVPKRVLVSISTSRIPMRPPWVAGPDSYLGTLVRLAGHEVVPADLGRAYGELSFENVLRADPDAIIEIRGLAGEDTSVAPDPRLAWPTIGPLRAARERRIGVLFGPRHVTPGPRFADTLDALVDLLR